MWLIFFFVLSVGLSQGRQRLDPLVQTSQGLIRGQKADDGSYYMFLGIPYAVVDENNPFGVSSPHPKFDDIYDAYDDSAICPQVQGGAVIGKLDCLHLNVYIPTKASSSNRLPVMIWIHGGAFSTGNGGRQSYGPKYLVQHDVILVTINYRVGPYGFFCLGIPEVPGNQGLKDQLIALRWIKENIENFGGDVNKITLMGESAGASSVELHLHSKHEKLYDRLILQSSTAMRPFGIHDTDVSHALRIAERLGYTTDDVSEAVKFLSQADPQLVLGAASALSITMRACFEKDLDNVDNFITDHIMNLDIPKIKGMPILAGFNSKEALMHDVSKPSDYFKDPYYFRDILQLGFDIDENFKQYEDLVRRFYVGDEDMREELRTDVIDFESDFYYNYPAQWSVEKFVKNGASNVYQYFFSYDGGLNRLKRSFNITMEGAAHADELGYLFNSPSDTTTPSDQDQLVIDRMTTMWTNFAKYGNPTPETTELLPEKWVPVTSDTINYLGIDSQLSTGRRPFSDRLAFWELFYLANKDRLRFYNK